MRVANCVPPSATTADPQRLTDRHPAGRVIDGSSIDRSADDGLDCASELTHDRHPSAPWIRSHNPTEAGMQLGELKFKRTQRTFGVFSILATVPFAYDGISKLQGPAGSMGRAYDIGVGLLSLSAVIGLVLLGVWFITRVVEIRARGVHSRSIFGERTIEYRNITGFSYAHLVVTGSTYINKVTIKLQDDNGKPIAFDSVYGKQIEQLSDIADTCIDIVVERLEQELARTGKAQIAPNLAIDRYGVWLDGTRHAFSLLREEILNGQLRLHSGKKTLATVPLAQYNIHPFLVLYKEYKATSVR
jgi:hypothetical protein